MRFVTTWRTAFPDLQFTIEDHIAEGNKVATRVTLRGTHSGRYLDIAPTGKKITVSGMTISHVVDGKIVEIWITRDDLGLLQQLGVVPQMEGS
jgi:predicted ester cyclase